MRGERGAVGYKRNKKLGVGQRKQGKGGDWELKKKKDREERKRVGFGHSAEGGLL